MLTLADLHAENLILFEAISGSHAYGLATPQSDTDIKGVFYLPRRLYYGLDYQPQISDASNDTTYYELGRFVELLLASNPTALELLAAPPDTIRQRAPLMDALRPAWFLSKACQQTFAGYALGQIKKARGLNKKINAPVAAKTPLDFCHILDGARTLPPGSPAAGANNGASASSVWRTRATSTPFTTTQTAAVATAASSVTLPRPASARKASPRTAHRSPT